MIYRMMVQDLARFGTVFAIFVMGFSQAYFIIFLTFKPEEGCDPDEDDDCVVRYIRNKMIRQKGIGEFIRKKQEIRNLTEKNKEKNMKA